MQAVFFIALFGLVMALISTFTVGISANSMQVKENRLTQLQRNFDNLEFAINSVFLKEHTTLQDSIPSLSAGIITLSPNDLSIFLPYMRTNLADLVADPWRQPIRYYAYQNPVVLCNDTNPSNDYDCWVEAPVVYFVMVSAGPDRQFESGPDGQGGAPAADPIAFLSYAKPADSDDIIKVFSTESAMRQHYNNMTAVENQVEALILKSYRDQNNRFLKSAAVQNYINTRLDEVLSGAGFFDNIDPTCTTNCFPEGITQDEIFGEIIELPAAQSWPDYPRMKGTSDITTPKNQSVAINASAFGAEGELQFDPLCMGQTGCVPFTIVYDDATPWQVSIERNPLLVSPSDPSAGSGQDLGGWKIYTQKIIHGK